MIQFPSSINKIESMADGGFRVRLDIPELSPPELAILFGYRNKELWTVLADTHVKQEEINVPDAIEMPEKKSPAKRLRNTIYILWTQSGKKGEFDQYYEKVMEKFIDTIKDKLN